MEPDDLLCSRNARPQKALVWTRAVGDHLARPQGRRQKNGGPCGEKKTPDTLAFSYPLLDRS